MAQLGNTVVNGSLRVVGDFYANGYIDTTVTLTAAGWSGTDLFTQTINVAGVKADNNYRVYQYISSGATAAEIKTYLKNFSCVTSGYATPADGSITFTTIKKPTANITIRIVGDSNVERTTVENTEVTNMKSDIASINTDINTLNTSLTKLYPVGSIYLSVNDTNPSTFIGGTWKLVGSGKTLWGADMSHAAGTTIDAGLPNITGWIQFSAGGYGKENSRLGGAFYTDDYYGDGTSGYVSGSGQGTLYQGLRIDASRSDAIYGSSSTVQPPAYVVYIWQRTA